MQVAQRCTSARLPAASRSLVCQPSRPLARPVVLVKSGDGAQQPSTSGTVDLEKDVTKLARQVATFAPRSSTAKKNPAVKGSLLYDIFEWQAWLCMAAGGLLSFNLIWPTDEPSIPRLLGMWMIWMLTVPSLRAKDCTAKEKDALNILFLIIPLVNITLPFFWKSFPFIYSTNVIALVGVYWWKGVWKDVYGLPFEWSGVAAADAVAAAAASAAAPESSGEGPSSGSA
ncbi:hypothetical protein HYH03_006529 [Edaphochlamys debaryana]|uniref:Uncharacterized protein n=1 Tax=Edaphochlamys debaryana TaxID=47281 RepID=A0A835Y3G5_9CHLO|nr:hypothetical protein HYH03_006529 [Edaphochlamys debaryana]|eukprot:KAG2495256.1 hypothetical protein HYH03_006529 [Edaphochlamys debaryana]